MASRVHVLAMIHGITPEAAPDVHEQYAPFRKALERAELPFASVFEVEWGVPDSRTGEVARPDQFLLGAEIEANKRVEYAALRRDRSPTNELARGLVGRDWGIPGLRQISTRVRENLVQYGLADAAYYAAPEGERAVRDAVFAQVLGQLQRSADGGEVHLHLVAHSLGVTIAHDFLFSLFGPPGRDFPKQTESPTAKELYDMWRAEADAGRLKLGTFISLASQLPVFMLRKQKLVESFWRGEYLDPRVIGVDPHGDKVQWAIFYDRDDVLGFASRRLYQDTPAIHDIQINSGLEPLTAHLGYWGSRQVIERSLELLRANTQ